MATEQPPKFNVIGDEACLTYAFGELAYNIRHHAGVEKARIDTQYFGYRIDINIFDRGKGFRLEDKDAAFLPYWQADLRDHGLGLGLFLAKRFIEGSGGAIAISSEPNRGTLVKVSLQTIP